MESTHGRVELLGPGAELPAAGLLLELDIVLAFGVGDVNDRRVAVDVQAGNFRRAVVGLGQGVEIGCLTAAGDVLERLAILGAKEGEHLLEVIRLGGLGHPGDGLLDRLDVLLVVGAGGAGRIDDLVAGMRPDTLRGGVGGQAQDQQGDQEDAERAADDGQRLLLRGQRRPGRLGGRRVAARRHPVRAGLLICGELLGLSLLELALWVLRLRHLCICPSTAAVMAFSASVPDGGGAGWY